MVGPSQQVFVVERPLAGVSLTDFLEQSCGGDRLAVRRLVAAGDVRVNGVVCLSSRRLRTGDVVMMPGAKAAVTPRARPTRVADLPEVLFESATLLVVDKPAGLPTVPDRSGEDRGVHGLLERLRPGADLRIVHRLDRDTSGCLLLGKGIEAARHFDERFREGGIAKTYVAVVHGSPAADAFTIDAFLGPDPRRPGKVVASVTAARGFRDARTEVVVRERFERHALLGLHPRTGRGHQLRVHLAHEGLPIVGDRDYGGEPLLLSQLKDDYKLRPGVQEKPLVERTFLHAERIVCDDVDGSRVDVRAPLPRDLAKAIERLGNNERRR